MINYDNLISRVYEEYTFGVPGREAYICCGCSERRDPYFGHDKILMLKRDYPNEDDFVCSEACKNQYYDDKNWERDE